MKKNLLILLTSITLLSSCADSYVVGLQAPSPTPNDAVVIDNTNLENKLNDILKSKLAHSKVDITVNSYNVLLTGRVANQNDVIKTEQLVKAQPGIIKVWNYLIVAIKDPKMQYSDSSLIDKASERLDAQPDLNTEQIIVTAYNNVIYIMGQNIGNHSALANAITGINAIEGVNKVVDLTQMNGGDYTAASSESIDD